MDPLNKSSIVNYFRIRTFLRGIGSPGGEYMLGSSSEDSEDWDKDVMRRIYPYACRAKIFSLPPELYLRVWDAVEASILKAVGANPVPHIAKHGVLKSGVVASDMSHVDKISVMEDIGEYLSYNYVVSPMPENLPFENMYFGYGEGIPISVGMMNIRFNEPIYMAASDGSTLTYSGSDFTDVRILGHLITSVGDVYEFDEYSINNAVFVPVDMSGIGRWEPCGSGGNTFGKYVLRKKLSDGLPTEKERQAAYRSAVAALAIAGRELIGGEDEFELIPVWLLPGSEEVDPNLSVLSTEDYVIPYVFTKRIVGICYFAVRVAKPYVSWGVDRAKNFREIMEDSGATGLWSIRWSLSAYTVPTIIDLINENNRSFVLKNEYDKSLRRNLYKKYKKQLPRSKKSRSSLPAYYTINVGLKSLKRPLVSAIKTTMRRGHTLSYRHDRDGHERVLIRRGRLPLMHEDRDSLRVRGYVVYTEGQPSGEDTTRLVVRRQPLREDGQWLAMKTSWVRSTIVGDESLPYKPAVRAISMTVVDKLLGERRA